MPDGVTFVDTNVLVYAHDSSESVKQPIAAELLRTLWETRSAAISTQVLQELYVVATRKFKPAMRPAEARELIVQYGAWPLIQVDLSLILAATQLEESEPLSFWDAMIVEAARRAGADTLVSEDLQDGRVIAGVRIQNPFV